MKECKYCNKPLEMALSGVRDFCNDECRKAHRKACNKDYKRKSRVCQQKGMTYCINPSDVSKSEPYQKPIYKDKNGGLGLGEGNFTLKTTKDGESIAEMYCLEYVRKKREGYCIREHLPHEIECQFCINEQIRLKTGQIFEALFGEIKGL